jgi:hypothetical protein
MAGNNIARATNGTHSIINYTLFVGVWWLFTLLYFLPTAFIDKFAIPIVDMVMDGLSVLFGFCAAVALPAYLGAHSCSNTVRNLLTSLVLTPANQDIELHCPQRRHQQLARPRAELPPGSDRDCLPVVRLGCIRRDSRLLCHGWQGWRCSRWHPPWRTFYEPGLGARLL